MQVCVIPRRALVRGVLVTSTMISTTTRTALAALALVLAPACATDPVDPMGEPAPDAGTPEEPAPDAPEEPTPDAPTPLAAGELDPAFGVGGVQTLPLLGTGYAGAIAAQGDKLLVCYSVTSTFLGWTSLATLVRLDAAGAIDTQFGIDGRLSFAGNGNTMCEDVNVRADLGIDLLYRTLGDNKRHMVSLTAGGVSLYDVETSTLSQISNGMSGATPVVLLGYRNDSGTQAIMAAQASGGGFARSTAAVLAGTPVRGFLRDEVMSAVGSYDEAGTGPTWQVLASPGAGVDLALLGPAAKATAGTATADLLHDAVQLPDGSLFAVGGVDNDLQVMAARFVPGAAPTVVVEQHAHGVGSSTGRAVALDGAGRPVVVGTGAGAGMTRFAWQRYAAASATLDGTYRDAGLAGVDAPSGGGELVDVVRVGAGFYALGHYDVETAEPRLALVRIAE